jgi:enoyl-CoA hydratase
MMEFETLIYEKKDRVAWITLNRPQVLNAANNRMRKELKEVLEEARDDAAISVIALTGAGDKAFSAGADISEIAKLTPVDQLSRYSRVLPQTLIRQIAKPVIAVVNGLALGGGCEMVLACDIAIASENAKFGVPEIKVGVIPGAGGTQILPRLIGEKRAKELLFTGRTITAAEAFQIGLINQVVPHESLREAAENFIAVLLKRSPVILKIAKLAANRASETTLMTGLSSETDLFAFCFSTEDRMEGAQAFMEKREPNFKGK